MKSTVIVLLSVLILYLGFNIYYLREDIQLVEDRAVFYEKRSDELHEEVLRLSRLNNTQEKLLNEIEITLDELDTKIQLKTLKRYVPKKIWVEISPIIDRLRQWQNFRQGNIYPEVYELSE
jgi:Tfp pilus assembly protein PilN